jgi:sulfur-oxidizing protein SoxZ
MSKDIRIRAKMKGDIAEIKTLMPHDMETGYRRDVNTNEPIPAHYITDVEAEHNGEIVMSAYWGSAVAKNPYMSFSFKGAAQGDTIKIRWNDNHGESSETEAAIK